MHRLRAALQEITRAFPRERTERPARLAETLGVDNVLAWKVCKIIESEDPFLAAQYLPGAGGEKILLDSARKRGVPTESLQAARDAFDAVRDLVKVHAGSRRLFNTMVSGYVTSNRERAELEHRRGAYESLGYVWGVQARTQVHTYILSPSDDGEHFDAAAIRGFVDLRRLRPNVPWRMGRPFSVDDEGRLTSEFRTRALDSESGGPGPLTDLPLMRRFCTQPLPRFSREKQPNGTVEYLLDSGPVGNAGLLSCFTGELIYAAEPRFHTERHRHMAVRAFARTPCETFLFDIFEDRELFGMRPLQLEMFSGLFATDPTLLCPECDRMPHFEKVETYERAADGVLAPEAPRYAEMIDYAFEQLGWDRQRFALHRVRIAYPPIPSVLFLSHVLPERPT